MYKFFIFLGLFISPSWSVLDGFMLERDDKMASVMSEICDNAIDDDMDGLIDLNDPDCECHGDFEYYVPNPSFEDTLCCPCTYFAPLDSCIGESGRIDCIPPWQNSIPRGFDFFHECAEFANRGISTSVPLPPPDGDGFFGFFTRGTGVAGETYKEYAIACLNNTLLAGDRFELGLSGGFISLPDDQVEISLFGTDNCANDNYDNDDNYFGCPANNSNWVELATISFAGNFEWVRDTVEFSVSTDINMIALGASCNEDLLFMGEDYHFIDKVELVRHDDRDLPISIVGADICAGVATLSIPTKPGATYQWYKDGIAIVGENGRMSDLEPTDPNGSYQVQIMNGRGCFLSEPYVFLREPVVNHVIAEICQGDFYLLGSEMITVAGPYSDTLTTAFGCDSIVNLDLSVIDMIQIPNSYIRCEGGQIQVGSNIYSTTGVYMDTLPGIGMECDSIFITNLTILPNSREDLTEVICGGDSVEVGSIIYKNSGIYFDTLRAFNGCDSFVQLDLTVFPSYNLNEIINLCPGDSTTINNQVLSEEGHYNFDLISSQGCDSTIMVEVKISQSPVVLPIREEVILGEELFVRPEIDLGLIDTLFWKPSPDYDISLDGEVNQTILPFVTGQVTMLSVDTFGCVWMDSLLVQVSKPYTVFIPNAFTPDFDGLNDYFGPYLGPDVNQVLSFMVFNRWGDLVYDLPPISGAMFHEDMGWPGTQSEEDSMSGVYIYMLRVEFIDGEIRDFNGDVTLLRK